MGHGRGKSASSPEVVPPLVPDLNVTGTLSPDATCNYFEAGIYNEAPYYKRSRGGFYIWQAVLPNLHYIGSILGDLSGPYWSKIGTGFAGSYNPSNGASGVALVSEGGH
jgi:hypothetical protein